MIGSTVTGCAFSILFHPLYVFGGLWLAVGVSAGTLLHPLAGFLLAVGGNSKAGSGPSSGCRCRGKVKVVERMNILVLKGPLSAQTGQGIQMFGSGGRVGELEHGDVDVHRIQLVAESIVSPPSLCFSLILAARVEICFPMCLLSAGTQLSNGYNLL